MKIHFLGPINKVIYRARITTSLFALQASLEYQIPAECNNWYFHCLGSRPNAIQELGTGNKN